MDFFFFFDRTGVWGRGQGGLWVNLEVRGVGHDLQVASLIVILSLVLTESTSLICSSNRKFFYTAPLRKSLVHLCLLMCK